MLKQFDDGIRFCCCALNEALCASPTPDLLIVSVIMVCSPNAKLLTAGHVLTQLSKTQYFMLSH
jgi:hypothetical protein